MEGHRDYVRSVAFSSDGTHIVSGSDKDVVRIWDVKTGTPVGEPLGGYKGDAKAVTFSPDGKNALMIRSLFAIYSVILHK